MNRALAVAVFFCFAVGGQAFAADDKTLDRPPAGIVPTTIGLAQILAAHEKAVGHVPPGTPNTTREHWDYIEAGTHGTELLVRSGTDYHSTFSYGPFTEQYGQLNHKRWHQDENGLTTPAEGAEERSFIITRVLEDAADPKNDARVLGQVDTPVKAYVVEVKVAGSKHPEWVFYDTTTFLIDRVESIYGKKDRITSTYDDFRTTKGVTQAWHLHDGNGHAELDDDWKRTALETGVKIGPNEFTMPPDQRVLPLEFSEVNVPVKFFGGDTVVVRVIINGRGLDFELNSGANGIILDRDVAREMNLPTYDQMTTTPDGKPVSYTTRVDDIFAGGLRLHNVAVNVEEFHYRPSVDTKVVGLLGYDFLRDVVLKLDYVNRTLTAMNPRDFDAPPKDDVFELPLTLDGGLPFITAKVGDSIGKRFMVNNGFQFTMLFGGFTRTHPDDVKDLGEGRRMMLPIVEKDSYGEEYEVAISQLKHFIFGPADYNGFTVISTTIPNEFDGEQVDGVIGFEFLRFYDVVFDYPHSRLLLHRNEWFNQSFAPVKK